MCFLCSYAEQLVLYLKVAELLSSGLQMAIEQIKAGKLCLSSTVKQGKGPLGARRKGLAWNGSIKNIAKGMKGVGECEPSPMCPGTYFLLSPCTDESFFIRIEGNPLFTLTLGLKTPAHAGDSSVLISERGMYLI